MNPLQFLRVLVDQNFEGSLRQSYWQMSDSWRDTRTLFHGDDADLRTLVREELRSYLAGHIEPVRGATIEHARAAVDWLLAAQAATADDGVSLGYFPANQRHHGWLPSYPETTGYIITSLLRYARRFDDARARDAAIRMGAWESSVLMASGAVQGGPVVPAEQQTAAAFNTGMVLDGWCSLYAETGSEDTLASARRAADFLVGDLDRDGYFKTNGAFVSAGEIKTYTCLCAWAVQRFGDLSGEQRYLDAAMRVVDAALRQQQANGWFAHNCLSHSAKPLTHTIGYTLQGVLEVGLRAGREDCVAAVRRALDGLLVNLKPDGYLAGRFDRDWRPAALSACLTGSAQIAIVCFRLAAHGGGQQYAAAAHRLVDFLKAMQRIDRGHAAVRGALGGSYPLWGEYMRAGYPNWATKYLLDALLLQDEAQAAGNGGR